MSYKQFYNNLKETNPAMPERLGDMWTDVEEGKVLQLIKEEYSIKEIADELKRSEGGIKARLRVIACDMHKSGITNENIRVITSLSEDDVNKAVKKYNKKIVEKMKKEEKIAQIPISDLREIKLLLIEMRDLMRKMVIESKRPE